MSRTVSLTLEASVGGLVSGLKTGSKAVNDFGRDLEKWRSKNEKSLDTLGAAAGKAGLGIAAGLALAGKAAMDWESDWTGVLKTVDGTPAQLGKVEDGLRGLAKTLPSTHTEIAAVAEAAGQLGVKTNDVVGFTKVMIDLGQSTNLSAEEAATSLARFSNVMGTSTDDVGRLGATLVGLGNNYATTESEIMGMSMRLSGASKQIGLSEGQTMGLAAAMSSVGIEAEAGGSAMSLTMKRVGKAVDEGGASLETFAGVSGMTAEQFATMWKEDAAGGLEAFTLGLGKAGENGESVNAILTELGITGIRESDALLRLSSAGELMGSSMKAGADEYADGSALIEEATKRYETAESKVKIAWNNIKDAAITAGSVMLPIIANLADGAADLANWFGSLPKPVLNFLTAIAGITGGGLLAVAGLVKMAKSAAELSTAMTAIYGTSGRAHKAIGTFGKVLSTTAKAAGIAAVGFVALQLAIAAHNSTAPDAKKLEDYTQALLGVKEGTQTVDDAFKNLDFGKSTAMEGQIDGVADALKRLAPATGDVRGHLQSFGADVLNIENGLPALRRELEGMSDAMAVAVEAGDGEAASKMFMEMAESATAGGESIDSLMPYMDSYTNSLKEVANQAGATVADQELLSWALSGVAPEAVAAAQALEGVGGAGGQAGSGAESAAGGIEAAAEAAAEAAKQVDDFYDSLVAVGAITLSERDALRGLEASFDAAAESAKKNGENLKRGTEAGRENEAALDGIAQATLNAVRAQEEKGRSEDEMAETMKRGRKAFIDQATDLGMSEKAAKALADEMNLIPENVRMEIEDNAEEVKAKVEAIPDMKNVKVVVTEDGTVSLTKEQIESIQDRTISTRVTDDGTIMEVQGGINNVEGTTEFILVNDDGTVQVVQEKINKTTGKTEYIKVTDDGTVSGVQGKINNVKGGAAGVSVSDGGTVSAVQGRINNIKGTSVKVNVSYGSSGGNFSGAGASSGFATGGWTGPGGKDEPKGIVHGDEFVVRKASRGPFEAKHPGLLDHINRNGTLEGYASGGRVGAAEKKVKSTKRAYDRISGDKANRLRKLAAKDQYDAAKAELAAVKKSSKASADAAKKAADARKKAAEEEKARQGRLSDSRRDLRTDLRRGDITDSFTSGSGLSQIDKLGDASRNKDYSLSKRKGLARDANALEKSLTILTKKSEGLKAALESATKQADELRSVRDSVAGDLRGEFSLSGMLSTTRQDLGATPFTARGISGAANKMAKRIEIFAGRLNRLRKMGYGEAIIQEVAGLGTEDGITVAGVLMNATKGEKSSIVGAYKRLDTASNKAGQYVTESMYKGGLDAADGLVRGLESKTKSVDSAFYKLGKNAEKAFKRSLGIKSPSRVMFGAGVNVGEGAELGILSKVSDVQGAMGLLAEAPVFSVPPSAEVARYAAQPAGGGQVNAQVIADAVAGAIASYQPIVNIDGRKFYGVMQAANQQARRR